MPLPQEKIIASQQLVIDVFKGFRDELMAVYGNVEHDSKGDGSQVTLLDVKVEEALKARLRAAFPEIGFHGEETEDVVGSENALWVVDPIDGTSSFTHGLPYCTNMAGLVRRRNSCECYLSISDRRALYGTSWAGSFSKR